MINTGRDIISHGDDNEDNNNDKNKRIDLISGGIFYIGSICLFLHSMNIIKSNISYFTSICLHFNIFR